MKGSILEYSGLMIIFGTRIALGVWSWGSCWVMMGDGVKCSGWRFFLIDVDSMSSSCCKESERKVLGWCRVRLDFHPPDLADLSQWVVWTLSRWPCENVVDSPYPRSVEVEFLVMKFSLLLRILYEIPLSRRYGRQSGMGVSLGS